MNPMTFIFTTVAVALGTMLGSFSVAAFIDWSNHRRWRRMEMAMLTEAARRQRQRNKPLPLTKERAKLMRPALLALLAALLTGCSVGLLGDAEAACERIEAAIVAHEEKCGLNFRGSLPDCEGLVMGASGKRASECEARLDAIACGEPLPDECRWEGL